MNKTTTAAAAAAVDNNATTKWKLKALARAREKLDLSRVVAGKIVNIYQHFSTGHADVFAGQETQTK